MLDVDVAKRRVHVHYMGWKDKWDAWLSLKSKQIAPLHSHVKYWRNLSINDRVEVRQRAPGHPDKWIACTVTAMDEDGSLSAQIPGKDGDCMRVNAMSENICEIGTHIERWVNQQGVQPAHIHVRCGTCSLYHGGEIRFGVEFSRTSLFDA